VAKGKPKVNPGKKQAQVAGRSTSPQNPQEAADLDRAGEQNASTTPVAGEAATPSATEGAATPVFDDDSMFNSADRQSAVLARERAGRTGPQKKTKAAPRQTERRKAG